VLVVAACAAVEAAVALIKLGADGRVANLETLRPARDLAELGAEPALTREAAAPRR